MANENIVSRDEPSDVAQPDKTGTGSNPVDRKSLLPNFLDFAGLLAAVPLGARTLREEIKLKHIPCIKMPGGRRLLFHWPSVEAALLRFQTGGIE